MSLQYFLVLALGAGLIRVRILPRGYTEPYWTRSTGRIFSCIANLRMRAICQAKIDIGQAKIDIHQVKIDIRKFKINIGQAETDI